MVVLNQKESDYLREMYINRFIDTDSVWYQRILEWSELRKEGLCYRAFLWEALPHPADCYEQQGMCVAYLTEEEVKSLLKEKTDIYVMMDLHPIDFVCRKEVKFRKKYERKVLCFEKWTDKVERILPEDIYIFDSSISWSIVLTHETYGEHDEMRLCFGIGEYKKICDTFVASNRQR